MRFAFAALQGAAIADDIGLDDQATGIVDMLRALAVETATPRPSLTDLPTEETIT